MDSFCIYESTNLRIHCWIVASRIVRAPRAFSYARIASLRLLRTNLLRNVRGTLAAFLVTMNPQAEALKKRTFSFALQVVYCCRELRKTWEGDEFADRKDNQRAGAARPTGGAKSHNQNSSIRKLVNP